MARLLTGMGMTVVRDGRHLALRAAALASVEAPYELVKTMRASILVLGPLLARAGAARVSLPGGCAIGARPVDQHLKGLQALGAELHIEQGYIVAQRTGARLRGTRIVTDHGHRDRHRKPDDGRHAGRGRDGDRERRARARGRRPGALPQCHGRAHRRRWHGSHRHRRRRAPARGQPPHHARPHRKRAPSWCAVAAAGGDVMLERAAPQTLDAVLEKLREAGADVQTGADWVRLRMNRRPQAVSLRTAPYPAFPTDAQAQFMALNCIADGVARISENIFENRFMHVAGTAAAGRTRSISTVIRPSCGASNASQAPRSWPPTCARRPAW